MSSPALIARGRARSRHIHHGPCDRPPVSSIPRGDALFSLMILGVGLPAMRRSQLTVSRFVPTDRLLISSARNAIRDATTNGRPGRRKAYRRIAVAYRILVFGTAISHSGTGPRGTAPNKGGEASLYVVFCVAGTKCCVGKHSVITGNNRSRRMLRAIPRIPPAASPRAAFSCSQRRAAAPPRPLSTPRPDINLH